MLVATRSADETVISVHNNGPEIAPTAREKIFNKFDFSDRDGRRMAGWGPGLYFCRLVVEAHQGRISVENIPGWPTSFVIRMPLPVPAEVEL